MVIPDSQISALEPAVRDLFTKWRTYMYERVTFNMADSLIHSRPHCERVLLYALLIGRSRRCTAEELETLAHAAVFHDTRRLDDYLDTGHGARAAIHYRDFCKSNKDMVFHRAAEYLMRYHDLDDAVGRKAIMRDFDNGSDDALQLYDIFKDADALDRWRLGSRGLDPKYLRTSEARDLIGYAHKLVADTTDPELLRAIEDEVNDAIDRQQAQHDS